jgi:type 1 fimbria pilin
MTGPFFSTTLVACALAMSLVTLSAKAADGRVIFSGAIVEPTCHVDQRSLDMASLLAAEVPTASRVACAGASGPSAVAPQAYTLTVSHLSTETPDRLLRYFAGYVAAGSADRVDASLLTQTYD